MDLSTAANVAQVAEVLVIPAVAWLVYQARKWVKREIISLLRNDDTPVAVYAHNAQNAADAAKTAAEKTDGKVDRVADKVDRVHDLLAEHIMDRGAHGSS